MGDPQLCQKLFDLRFGAGQVGAVGIDLRRWYKPAFQQGGRPVQPGPRQRQVGLGLVQRCADHLYFGLAAACQQVVQVRAGDRHARLRRFQGFGLGRVFQRQQQLTGSDHIALFGKYFGDPARP